MADSHKNLLSVLIAVSKLDASLAGIRAERKRIETDLQAKLQQLKKAESESQTKTRLHQDRKAKYAKEEKGMKEEQAKLIDRRKALASLSNYKLQQAAGKEIDSAAHHLGLREEGLLKMLDEVDTAEKEAKKSEEALTALRSEVEKLAAEAKDNLAGLAERESRVSGERAAAAQGADETNLKNYERIRDKFPMGAVLPVKNNSCSGCFIQVGPQVLVQIARGDALVRCRGCGRILYLEQDELTKLGVVGA